jgi:hypothetical protein
MATLPLYQQTGYLPADVPRLDLANLKEQANQLNTITSSLDRLSNFAFKKAAEQAEREGLQYGAENQPSLDQVMAAMQRGESPQELFAKPGTVFGDAARKVQAAQLRNELEVLGRKKFADLSAAVDNTNFNLQEVQQEIASITNGYARAVSSVSPEEGLKFRASMATAGNSVYVKATERAAKIYNEGLKANADELISQTPIILADTFKAESDPVMLAQRVAIEKQRVFDIALQAGPEFLREKLADFDRQLLSAVTDYVASPEFSKNALDGLNRINRNDFGKMSEVMKRVNKDKLIKNYSDRMGEMATAWERANKLEQSTRIDEVNLIKDQMYAGRISGTVALNRIKALGVNLPDSERKSMLDGDNAGANAMMYGQFESLADRQLVGENYFDELANANVISWKQANTLKKVVRNDNPEMSRARQFIQNSLGVPDMMAPGFGNEKATVASLNRQLAEAQQRARNAGEAFNPMAFADELVKSKEAQNIITENDNRVARLTKIFEKHKVVYDKTRTYTADDLTRLGIPKSEHQNILNKQKGR